MSWEAGDRLRVTLEITAQERSDETSDIWFGCGAVGRSYLNAEDIQVAGGTVFVEVIPKPVDLPDKKWASVTLRTIGGDEILVTRIYQQQWESFGGVRWSEKEVAKRYVRTLFEGVDE